MTRDDKPRSSSRSDLAAIGLIVGSACGFGSLSTLTNIVAAAGMTLIPAMFWRYALATLILAGIVGLRTSTERRFSPRLLLIGGGGQSLISIVTLSALRYISVAPLAFLFYTYPAWVAVFAAIRGTDRLTPRRVFALLLALAGTAMIVGSPFHTSLDWRGVILALGGALLYGLYIPTISSLQRDSHPMVAALHIAAGASIVFGIICIGGRQFATPSTIPLASGVLTLALVCTVGAFWLFLAGLETLGPVRSAIVSTVEPFYTMLLGALVLGDRLTGHVVAGGVAIAVAVIVMQTAKGEEKVMA